MHQRLATLAAAAVALLGSSMLAGCSGQPASRPLPGGLALTGVSATPRNGWPISLTLVRPGDATVLYLPPGGHAYSLTYWSRGVRAQAYLDVPRGKGPLPLLIALHGGYTVAEPGHSDLVYWNQTSALVLAQPTAIAFLPNYVGYGPSRGRAGDAYEDTLDVENGLRALRRIAGLHIAPDATYLFGFSLAGAVGALLAGQDRGVRAAAFVSPWPGARRSLDWYEANLGHLDEDERVGLDTLAEWEGTDPQSQWYRRNSYGYGDLRIPLLLIGGTQDNIVPAALLSATAQDLRRCGHPVELKFFPGGHAVYSGDVQAFLQSWFQAHGIALQL